MAMRTLPRGSCPCNGGYHVLTGRSAATSPLKGAALSRVLATTAQSAGSNRMRFWRGLRACPARRSHRMYVQVGHLALSRSPIAASAVVADNAVDHHQDAKGISLIDATAQRLLPARDLPAFLHVEPKCAPHCRRGRGDV